MNNYVNHYVMWDFAEGLDKEISFTQVKNLLEKLKYSISEVISIEVVKPSMGSNCDVALISTFETEEDLNIYKNHEEHLKVVEQIKPLLTNRRCLDFIK